MTTTLDLATGPVLLRAANLIVTDGHAKQDYRDDNGACCAAGAIAAASGLTPADWGETNTPDTGRQAGRAAALDALRALIHHINPTTRPEAMTRRQAAEWVALWNDHPDRTVAQVVTAMRAAAREAVASRG